MTTSDGVVITRSSQKLSLLNIDAVKARHRGNYTCYAKNKAGISKHSAFLAINGDFAIINVFNVSSYKQFFRILQITIIIVLVLPIIVPFEFGDEPINIHESVSAMCSVNKGDLPINIWWSFYDVHFKLERNLTNNDGIVITKLGHKSSVLTIESAQPRHRGNYTCFAQNKGGVAQHSAYLSINGDFN